MKKFLVLGMILTMLFLMSSTVMANEGSWGAGFGIPYGIMGISVDYNIISYVDLSLGLGINPLAGPAYNVGAKLYLASEERNFRPRVSCYYGTNTVVDRYIGDYINCNGVTAGVGASVYFGQARQHGMDFDFLYIVSSEAGYDNSLDVTKGMKISVGYRQRLN